MQVSDTFGTPQRGKSQAVVFTGTSAQSAAIDADSICVQATSACFVEIGANPTATVNTSHYIGANQPTYLQMTPGFKIAAVQLSAGGTLYVTPF